VGQKDKTLTGLTRPYREPWRQHTCLDSDYLAFFSLDPVVRVRRRRRKAWAAGTFAPPTQRHPTTSGSSHSRTALPSLQPSGAAHLGHHRATACAYTPTHATCHLYLQRLPHPLPFGPRTYTYNSIWPASTPPIVVLVCCAFPTLLCCSRDPLQTLHHRYTACSFLRAFCACHLCIPTLGSHHAPSLMYFPSSV